jgi:heterodisulfide reductase subunit B
MKLTQSMLRTLREANRTGADAIVTYCAGCLEVCNTAKIMYRWSRPIYHLLELLQLAIGEKPERLAFKRAMQMFMGTVRYQFPTVLSRRTFEHPPIGSEIP